MLILLVSMVIVICCRRRRQSAGVVYNTQNVAGNTILTQSGAQQLGGKIFFNTFISLNLLLSSKKHRRMIERCGMVIVLVLIYVLKCFNHL